MSRGMETLWHKRNLLNPFTYGTFAWKLFSHKVCRWLTPWALLGIVLGVAELANAHGVLPVFLAAAAATLALAVAGWLVAGRHALPRWLMLPTGVLCIVVATMYSWIRALKGTHDPTWEPTRRAPVVAVQE